MLELLLIMAGFMFCILVASGLVTFLQSIGILRNLEDPEEWDEEDDL